MGGNHGGGIGSRSAVRCREVVEHHYCAVFVRFSGAKKIF